VLKTLFESRIVVGFGGDLFARRKGALVSSRTGHGQIADTNIDTDHLSVLFGSRVSYFNFEGDKQ
jgi:hypothetical protein